MHCAGDHVNVGLCFYPIFQFWREYWGWMALRGWADTGPLYWSIRTFLVRTASDTTKEARAERDDATACVRVRHWSFFRKAPQALQIMVDLQECCMRSVAREVRSFVHASCVGVLSGNQFIVLRVCPSGPI